MQEQADRVWGNVSGDRESFLSRSRMSHWAPLKLAECWQRYYGSAGRPLCRPDYNGTGRRPSLQINIARGAADPPNPQWRDGQDAKFSATDGHGFTQIKTKAGRAKMFFSFAIRVSSV